uniref:Tetratricopeptide repeat protein n=1 Tax=Schlesneria paludicola TaxID=360056 RepID=A0A7C4LL85_9PLAN
MSTGHPSGDGIAAAARARRSSRNWLAVAVLATMAASIAVQPVYSWWHQRRSRAFKSACSVAVRDKDWNKLEAIADRWVQWDPANGDGWVYLAEAAAQMGQVERAVEALGRVSNSYSGALEALALRGEMQFGDLNRPYDAVATWKRMLEINRRADVARQRLIYFYSMTFQRSALLAEIRTAMELECEPPEAYAYFVLANELNFTDGMSVVSKWRDHYPDDETLEVAHAIYVAKYAASGGLPIFGQSTVASGDLTPIDACLKKYPANLEVLAFHLEYAIYDGNEPRVLELLQQCPAAAENDPRFWRYRAWYLASQEQFEEAEKALRKSLELFPADWQTWLLLGNVLRRLGRPEAAEAADIALMGKQLKRELFELPNARSLNKQLGEQVYRYLKRTGPAWVWQSLERRLF